MLYDDAQLSDAWHFAIQWLQTEMEKVLFLHYGTKSYISLSLCSVHVLTHTLTPRITILVGLHLHSLTKPPMGMAGLFISVPVCQVSRPIRCDAS